jgi:hypothetical protein
VTTERIVYAIILAAIFVVGLIAVSGNRGRR